MPGRSRTGIVEPERGFGEKAELLEEMYADRERVMRVTASREEERLATEAQRHIRGKNGEREKQKQIPRPLWARDDNVV
jgi:hypothetical protein